MPTIIGLTGSIASGKSTVSKIFLNLGFFVLDCDEINRNLLTKKEVQQELILAFGNAIVDEDGTFSKVLLAKLIFSDAAKRETLNNIMHPKIKKIVLDEIKKSKEEFLILDVPLLFETSFYTLCDYTIVVYVDLKEQIDRLRKRDNIEFIEALNRIRSQESLEEKVKKASYVIDNRHRIEDLEWQVVQVMQKIRKSEKDGNS